MWEFNGSRRPAFAEEPGPGQESVWDYPRPPRLEASEEHVRVLSTGRCIADSRRALRMLETASPPTYYLPAEDIDWDLLQRLPHASFCEWKGAASYFALSSEPQARPAAWLYAEPARDYAAIHRHVSFYPSLVECYVDGERVRPQRGGFYGGWVTDRIVGPCKGAAGTGHW